jgi:tetratricopeptide (TPR) repeat protein
MRATSYLVMLTVACLLASAGFAEDRAELAAAVQDARAAWKLPFVTVNYSQPDEWLARATQLLISNALEAQRDANLSLPDEELLTLLNLARPLKWPEERLDLEQRLVDALMVFRAQVGEICYLSEQTGQLSATLLRITPMETVEVQVTGASTDIAAFLNEVLVATLQQLQGQRYQPPAAPMAPAGVSAGAIEAMGRALLLAESGQLAEALTQAQLALSAAPEWGPGYYAQAVSLTGLGRLEEATAAAAKAAQLWPEAMAPKELAARLLYLRGEADQAIQAAFKCLERAPGSESAFLTGAAARWATGDIENGSDWLAAISEAAPWLMKPTALAITRRVSFSGARLLEAEWIPYVMAPYASSEMTFDAVQMLKVVAPNALIFRIKSSGGQPWTLAEAQAAGAEVVAAGKNWPLRALFVLGEGFLVAPLEEASFATALGEGFELKLTASEPQASFIWKSPGALANSIELELRALSPMIAAGLDAGWVFADSTRADLQGDRPLLALWARPSLVTALRTESLPVARTPEEKAALAALLAEEQQQFSAVLKLVSEKLIILLTAQDGEPLFAPSAEQVALRDPASGASYQKYTLSASQLALLANYFSEETLEKAAVLAFDRGSLPLFDRGAKAVTLELTGVGGGASRTFTWPIQEGPGH